MDLKGKTILFLGDSITEGCGTSSPMCRFTNLIADMSGAVCRNFGICGTRIARQRTPSAEPEFDRDFCERVPQMDDYADVVVVFGGTNDFDHGDAPLGQIEDRTVYSFYGALHMLYTSLLKRYPLARIVVLTPTHRLTEDSLHPNETLADYVKAIRRVAEFYALPVLDLYATSGIQPRVALIQESYMPDGLHPNDAGHTLLARQILAFLQSIG